MFLLFFVLWIIFNGQVTVEICLFGLGISAALYLFVWKVMGYQPKNDLRFFRRFLGMIRFAGLLVAEICKSCLVVVKMIYTPGLELRPQLAEFSPPWKRTAPAPPWPTPSPSPPAPLRWRRGKRALWCMRWTPPWPRELRAAAL